MPEGDDNFGESRVPHSAPAKSADGSNQDVFNLTGTTFAGATDMYSTAGPSDTRPGTEAGYGVPIGRIGEEMPEDESSFSTSARNNRLLIEAELRADQQAMARTTMLDLARALDQSNSRSRELAALLRAECENSSKLSHDRDRLQREVDKLEAEEEKRLAAILTEKALSSGNNVVFNMLLEKSREVYDFNMFDPNKKDVLSKPATPAADPKKENKEASGEEGGSKASGEEGGSKPIVPLSEEGATRELTDTQQEDEATRELADADAEAGSLSGGGSRELLDCLTGAVGDRVTVTWVIKLWWQQVEKTRERLRKEREEEERRRKEEEERRRIEEAKQKAVEEVRKIVRDLEAQLERARKLMEDQQKTQDKLEKELKDAREAADRERSAAKAREEELKGELNDTKASLAKAHANLIQLQEDYDASQEALRRADEAFAHERAQLKNVIRQVSSELHEAMVLAKHMRETALKAKRDAAGSVSPSKFAELIAQLEEMKNQLSTLSKDCANEKESNAWLMRQLDKNKRQLELERQFLPLLRKVRGPIGPKNKGAAAEEGAKRSKDATQLAAQASQNTMPPLAAGNSPNRMRMSQSMGALTDPRAATAGGTLNGGRSGGFLDDQSRFASSLGYASSNGPGSPMRG